MVRVSLTHNVACVAAALEILDVLLRCQFPPPPRLAGLAVGPPSSAELARAWLVPSDVLGGCRPVFDHRPVNLLFITIQIWPAEVVCLVV